MNAIVILFVAGVMLLGFEVFVPGAILGILGGVALLAGVIVAFTVYGSSGGLVALGGALALTAALLVVEFVWLPRTAFGQRFFLRAQISSTSQPPLGEATLIGSTAEAVTPLSPSGFVMVGGRRYEAFSQSGQVQVGESLRVVGVDNFRIIVNKPNVS